MIIDDIRCKAAAQQKTIVLPEADDERVLKAANYLSVHDICKVCLLGEDEAIRSKCDSLGLKFKNIQLIDPKKSDWSSSFSEILYKKRKHKGMTKEQAEEGITDRLYFGAAMVASGHADGAVAGSIATTGDVLRAALHIIGLKEHSDVVSSTFLMSMPDGRTFTYGDCAVVPYPTAMQLATIAIDSANTHQKLTGEEPSVALLSFSTKGSASHERVELVTKALRAVEKREANLSIDGELQFDTALVPEIGRRKAPSSSVAGNANVFIFPNLDAGNIGYKITERLAGASATGPIIQGLDKPMMDLSRGCKWEDIVNTAAVCSLMA